MNLLIVHLLFLHCVVFVEKQKLLSPVIKNRTFMDMWYCFVAIFLLTCSSEATTVQTSAARWFKKRQFPFFAYIDIPSRGRRSQFQESGCGATLIDPQWILTAAHCFPKDKEKLARLQKKRLCKVYAGSHGFEKNSIKNIYLHPRYVDEETPEGVPNVLSNDVAVAKLTVKYELNQHLKVVTLPRRRVSGEPKYGCKVGAIVGRENANSTEHYNETIVSTNVEPKQRQEITTAIIPSSTVFFSETTEQPEESFKGYFGGPYICYQLFYNEHVPYQYGVISYVQYNAEEKKTIIVYEEVLQHLDFISDHVVEMKRSTQLSRGNSASNPFKMADMDESTLWASSSRKVGAHLVLLAVAFIMYFEVK